jgi:recombination protein RecR
MVLVVENVRDLLVIENTHSYHGIYHVLNGAISFSKGVTIDDLNINSLLEKVKNNELDEIILATSTTLEGETTSRYLKELLSPYNVNITRIAQGLSIGSDLAYQDEMTLIKAFEGRGKY